MRDGQAQAALLAFTRRPGMSETRIEAEGHLTSLDRIRNQAREALRSDRSGVLSQPLSRHHCFKVSALHKTFHDALTPPKG
jgi:hypothetical protein